MKKSSVFRLVTAIVLIAFAAITLFMSGSVLLDWFGIRAEQGNYVPFIIWTNFIAGFLYLISAYGLLKAQKWSFWVLVGTTLLLLITLIALVLFINYGGVYEPKTVKAMGFRFTLTIAFSVLAYFNLEKR